MDDIVYNEPSEVAAENGIVVVDGPDSVAVLLTPEAAEKTAERLLDGAAEAAGQRIVEGIRERQARRSEP